MTTSLETFHIFICLKDQSYSLEVPEGGFPKNESFVSEDFLSDSSEGEDDSSRGTWDNPIEFLLSCLSFAVGLGNIWRFPYLCYRNGGGKMKHNKFSYITRLYEGAFLIPYVISLIFMGLPVFLWEMSAGQFSSEGPISIWKICPLFQGQNHNKINKIITKCFCLKLPLSILAKFTNDPFPLILYY